MPIFVALLLGILVGYLGHLLHNRMRHRPSMVVDASWIATARSCWSGLSAYHDEDIQTYLSDQAQFRSAFPGYAASTDSDVTLLAGRVAPKDTLLSDSTKPTTSSSTDKDGGFRPAYVQPATQSETAQGPWTEYAKKKQDENDPWKVVDEKKYICSVTEGLPARFQLASVQTGHH